MEERWIWDRFAEIAALCGMAPALRQGEDEIGFAGLAAAAETLAATLPLAPGDRAVIWAGNGIPFAIAAGAVWRRGAIPVLVNAEAPVSHLDHAVRKTDAALVLANDPARVTGVPARGVEAPDAATPPAALPDHDRRGGDVASIVFTSGSTGLPKGVTQRAATLIDGAGRIGGALGYGDGDNILCPIPFAFDYGWGQFLSMMTQGIPLVLPETRNAFGLCAALERHRPTVLAGVPAVFAELAFGLAPVAETPRDSIRLITNTGSKIPGPVFERLLELFPRAELSLNYGLTETYRSAMLPVALAREKRSAVGYPAPGVTLLVLREDGTRAAPEEEGEIVHAGPGVFDGYWNDPERTARVRTVIEPEPGKPLPAVRTGDFGRIGTDGLLYVHGRRDRQIKCMGVRLSPDEIEQHLYDTGLLREVAITASDHQMFGALITAHAVPSDAEMPEKTLLRALKKTARETMSVYMQPRAYVLHAALPRNANDKIDYAALDRMAARQPEGASG